MRGGPGHQEADAWRLACSANRLLRARRERPGRRAAEQRDEVAPLHLRGHSMTSSAPATSVGGTETTRSFAVCRLMTSSNLVDWITGRSAGFAPFKMRPVYTPT